MPTVAVYDVLKHVHAAFTKYTGDMVYVLLHYSDVCLYLSLFAIFD